MVAPFLSQIRIELHPERPVPQGYALRLPVIRQLMVEPWHIEGAVTILTGENGTGKSTVLEALASALRFSATGGVRSEDSMEVRKRSVKDSAGLGGHCRVRMHRTPRNGVYLRAESHEAYVGEAIPSRHSHGEGVFEIIDEFSLGGGIIILDEPEAGVSPTRQMALLATITEAARRGSQFFIVTHSPILAGIPGAAVWECNDEGLHRTSWQRTECFRAMAEFIGDPEGTIRFFVGGTGGTGGTGGF